MALKAANALKYRGVELKKAVPALASALQHSNEMVRLAIIEMLSDLGTDASPAVPALTAALKDKDAKVPRGRCHYHLRPCRRGRKGHPESCRVFGG